MFHYFEAITNTSGDSLIGYFARVVDPATQNTVTISADDNGTPIVTTSGVENAAVTDAYGNLDFYVVPGTYHLDIYAPNATSLILRVQNVSMNSTKGDPGEKGDQGDPGEGLDDVMAPTGAALVGYGSITAKDALDANAAKLSKVVYVTDPPYNVTAALTPAQQSAGIMAAVNANKGGTIVIPAHLGLTYSGIILSGSTYNNTRIVVEDDSLFRANPNPFNGNFQVSTYCMFVFHDCDGCSIAIPGSLNGNRANQPASQQQPLVMMAGVTNMSVDDGWTVKEVRGDGFTVLKKTIADPNSTNSDTVRIGSGIGYNSADDGRNLVSVISGRNVTVGDAISRKIGGVINGERMPGGFDCEPDHNAGHYVENLKVGDWTVETVGTSGFAVIGASNSGNDTARDWNIVDAQWGNVTVKHTDTTALIGGPIIRRVTSPRWNKLRLVRASRNAGVDLDYLDYADGAVEAVGCSTGVTIGFYDFVNYSNIRCVVDNHTASAVLAVGVDKYTRIDVTARNPQGAGSYGLNIANAGRTGLTQNAVQYRVQCPFDVNLSFGVRNAGVIFGPGTAIVGGALLGYPNYGVQVASTDTNIIPTEQVQGRNYASVVPATGMWAADDFVKRVGIAAGGSPGWYNTSSGTPVFKTAATVAA